MTGLRLPVVGDLYDLNREVSIVLKAATDDGVANTAFVIVWS
jgi:hypothetical protein